MQWKFKPEPSKETIQLLQTELNIPYIIARLLAQRGIKSYDEARVFFRPTIDDLHDPFLMKDMDKAIKRIQEAIDNQEKILIYGDYDVDGTTAVSIVYSYFKEFYPHIETYIPDRYAEGYGVSFQGIDYAYENQFGLVIALDCGTKALDKIIYAKEKGIDFIIGDHHTPGEIFPEALAFLNPKRKDCPYPYKELSGAGIGFKIIQAFQENQNKSIEDIIPYLDLVAVSIGADMVPITGENRTMAYLGLKQIEVDPRPGLRALSKKTEERAMEIRDLVFVLAPRINAAGRIKHGKEAVKLLVEKDLAVANRFAEEIEEYNLERRGHDQRISEEALEQIKKNKEEARATSVVFDENWHKGVIGIVASRLIETYYRPTIVLTKSNGVLAGSVRSVHGFNVYEALQKSSEYIIQFGGHKYAAGLTVDPKQFENFKAKFEEVVKNTLTEEQKDPEIEIDAKIKISEIDYKLYRLIRQMAPFGPGNMHPVFLSESVNDNGYSKIVGKDNSHLKISVRELKTGKIMNGIGFGLADKLDIVKSGKPLSIVYTIEENVWQNRRSLQLQVKDIKAMF